MKMSLHVKGLQREQCVTKRRQSLISYQVGYSTQTQIATRNMELLLWLQMLTGLQIQFPLWPAWLVVLPMLQLLQAEHLVPLS